LLDEVVKEVKVKEAATSSSYNDHLIDEDYDEDDFEKTEDFEDTGIHINSIKRKADETKHNAD
jgi:hypothetical protein